MSTFAPEMLSYLRACTRLVVLTGAGVSAESGVPTFRDAQSGLWARFNPQDLATPQAFRRNPALVWDWYAYRRDLIAAVSPNLAHRALAALETHYPEFTLVTQNIDDLHRAAGSQRVIELHGNIRRVRCFECDALAQGWESSTEKPPRCRQCGGLLRPDVVWFGEALPRQALEDALRATQSCQAFFSMGTSGMVEPAASLPFLAKRRGALVVEINLEPTPLSAAADYAFHARAGEVLPALVRALFPPEMTTV
ncbi:MAG: NAD-dependent deacylase [Anaerolineales bacterium]